jgi:hypothetical protein
MTLLSFEPNDLMTVSEALDVAEDATGNFFKFSLGQWKRHRYEVKTLPSLTGSEISKHAFAMLNKCSTRVKGFEPKTKDRDYYFICLQDHMILKALRRDRDITLLPLLVYVFTHELVHIVRFCNFFQRFEVQGKEKDKEESVVHAKTYDILEDLSLPEMDYVLDKYRNHRVCDMLLS